MARIQQIEHEQAEGSLKKFYDESVNLYKDLSADFDMNIMYSERGHFTLAHTDAAVRTSRWRAEVNKHLGVDSELIDTKEIR